MSEKDFEEMIGNFMRGLAIFVLVMCYFICRMKVSASEAGTKYMSIAGVEVNSSTLTVKFDGSAQTDSGYYRLYAQAPYETGESGIHLGSCRCGEKEFSTRMEPSFLCKRIAVTGSVDGRSGTLCRSYVTKITGQKHTTPRFVTGKKGVLLSAEMVKDTQYLYELGSCQVIYNVLLGDVIKNGDIKYHYLGRDYYFNSSIVGQYDHVLQTMEDFNVQTTFVLLNNDSGDRRLIHRDARGAKALYYAFDTTSTEGIETLAAVVSFLAERYSGGRYGTVDNWIIGNEVNIRESWNYMPESYGLKKYVKVYADGFRICFNAIKAQNAYARVYISLDNEWNTVAGKNFKGKDFLDTFASLISKEGNIQWDVAIHPYNHPMTSTDCENQIGTYGITNTPDTTYLTMQNIGVLTNYLHQDRFLIYGEVRSVLCSEQGYTSSGPGGEDAQAKAIAYAYQQAKMNPDIDGFLLNRQQDAPEEIAQGLALGIMDVNGRKKKAFEAYKQE